MSETNATESITDKVNLNKYEGKSDETDYTTYNHHVFDQVRMTTSEEDIEFINEYLTVKKDKDIVAIGGWLMFWMISLYLGAIFTVPVIINQSAASMLLGPIMILSVACIVLMHMRSKKMLIPMYMYLVLSLFLDFVLLSRGDKSQIPGMITKFIWLSYFKKSKRVKYTLLNR